MVDHFFPVEKPINLGGARYSPYHGITDFISENCCLPHRYMVLHNCPAVYTEVEITFGLSDANGLFIPISTTNTPRNTLLSSNMAR